MSSYFSVCLTDPEVLWPTEPASSTSAYFGLFFQFYACSCVVALLNRYIHLVFGLPRGPLLLNHSLLCRGYLMDQSEQHVPLIVRSLPSYHQILINQFPYTVLCQNRILLYVLVSEVSDRSGQRAEDFSSKSFISLFTGVERVIGPLE